MESVAKRLEVRNVGENRFGVVLVFFCCCYLTWFCLYVVCLLFFWTFSQLCLACQDGTFLGVCFLGFFWYFSFGLEGIIWSFVLGFFWGYPSWNIYIYIHTHLQVETSCLPKKNMLEDLGTKGIASCSNKPCHMYGFFQMPHEQPMKVWKPWKWRRRARLNSNSWKIGSKQWAMLAASTTSCSSAGCTRVVLLLGQNSTTTLEFSKGVVFVHLFL